MLNNNDIKSGDNSISSSGNHNTINQRNIKIISENPSRTVIFDLCKIIAEAKIEPGEYSIKKNGNWTKKLKYNNVIHYQDIFNDYCDNYNIFEEILSTQYIHREKMLRKVNHIYKTSLINNPEKELDGDFILQEVFSVLKCIVNQANYNLDELILDEEIDYTIILMMFYTITKCKLLQVPKDDIDDNK